MINYQEKGIGMFEYLATAGVDLYQLNGAWTYTGTQTEEEVNQLIDSYNPWPALKAKKLAEINSAFAAAVDELVAGSTSDERNSWAIQEREAVGWSADDTYPTPALTVLSQSRGIPFEILVEKVLAKAALYKQYYFALQGMRDRAEDVLKALPNEGNIERIGELDSIYFGV